MRSKVKYRELFPGDFCHTWNCGNLSNLETGFCSDCIPPAKSSILLRIYELGLKIMLKVFGVEPEIGI